VFATVESASKDLLTERKRPDPPEAIRDVGWIWAHALPIFLAGSLLAFLAEGDVDSAPATAHRGSRLGTTSKPSARPA
jgi:hypothetical protein